MEGLSSEQQRELEQQLQQLRKELEPLLSDSAQSSQPVALDQPIGRLSRMDAMQQQAMAKANRAGHQRRLQMVESALSAIKQQCYGDYRRCEEPIGYPRLKARPESAFCRDCQGQLEKGS